MTIWSVDFEGYDPEREGLREALCTVGNGRFATRGALPGDPVAFAIRDPASLATGVLAAAVLGAASFL